LLLDADTCSGLSAFENSPSSWAAFEAGVTIYRITVNVVLDSDPEETVTYRRTRHLASDAPSQSTANGDHDPEVIETPSDPLEEVTSTNPEQQQSTGDDFVYENTDEVPYEGLDQSTVVNQGPPVPSVYDELSH